MKEHEFLDGISNIEPDVVERFVVMDNQLQKKAMIKSKTRGRWLRIAAIAACCSLIAGAVFITLPLFYEEEDLDGFDHLTDTAPDDYDGGSDNEKNDINANYPADEPIEHESNAEIDGDANVPKDPAGESADVNERPNFEETEMSPDYDAPSDDELEEEPELVFVTKIADERYKGYTISGFPCEIDRVGEKIGEINVEAGYQEIFTVRAEIYKVIGVDEKLCICIRYINDGEENIVNATLDFESYQFVFAENYSFASYEDMLDVLFDKQEA